MRLKLISSILSVALVVSIICSPFFSDTIYADETGDMEVYESTEDISENGAAVITVSSQYNHYSGIKYTYLYEISGGYERIEWINGNLISEKYTSDYIIRSSMTIPKSSITPTGCTQDKVKFGGVYKNSSYYYVVTAQDNPDQSNTLATLRVTKFDKNWKYISCCEVCNKDQVEIYQAFSFGSCDIKELDGMLWISTARTGFGEVHHQGKLNLIIDTKTMKLCGSTADFWHSFDQYLCVCNGKMYQLEISDGARGAYVEDQDSKNYTGGWNYNWFAGSNNQAKVLDIWETNVYGMWSYEMYAETGSLSSSDKAGKLLSVGITFDQDGLTKIAADAASGKEGEAAQSAVSEAISKAVEGYSYNVWIRSTTTDMNKTTSNMLTNYPVNSGKNAGIPHIVKINDNRFLVIWAVREGYYYDNSNLNYVFVDSDGKPISNVYSMKGYLSNCVPLLNSKGEVVWYATNYSRPVFYIIKPDGSSSSATASYDYNEMFRLYNPNSGEHFYTSSAPEKDNLVSVGWKYEGVAWNAPKISNVPVYRLYNPNAGDHHYTISAAEKDNLVKAGWRYEGIGWYSNDAKGVPLYRLYNPNAIAGSHHYTTSAAERDNLVKAGWKDEGTAWYGMK